MSGRVWTTSEIAYLRNHTNTECMEHLGRSYYSIVQKRYKENLNSPGTWTESEIAYLKQNSKKQTMEEMAEVLGRSAKAVKAACIRKRISRRNPNYYWNNNQVATLEKMCEAGYTIYEIADAVGKSSGAVLQKCKILGVTYYTVKPEWAKQ